MMLVLLQSRDLFLEYQNLAFKAVVLGRLELIGSTVLLSLQRAQPFLGDLVRCRFLLKVPALYAFIGPKALQSTFEARNLDLKLLMYFRHLLFVESSSPV